MKKVILNKDTITLDKQKFENVISFLVGVISLIIILVFVSKTLIQQREVIASNFFLVIIVLAGYCTLFLICIYIIIYFIERYLKIELYKNENSRKD